MTNLNTLTLTLRKIKTLTLSLTLTVVNYHGSTLTLTLENHWHWHWPQNLDIAHVWGAEMLCSSGKSILRIQYCQYYNRNQPVSPIPASKCLDVKLFPPEGQRAVFPGGHGGLRSRPHLLHVGLQQRPASAERQTEWRNAGRLFPLSRRDRHRGVRHGPNRPLPLAKQTGPGRPRFPIRHR